MELTYEYEPYLSQNGTEIPCFRIYSGDVVIAQTNEDLPLEAQEDTARLIVQAGKLASGLAAALAGLKSSGMKPDGELISRLEEILNQASAPCRD